ncbi:hypothetical protein FS837_002574 [Tulasnella sp. UAMH 9824]|nr:hypothetical protein FS837_002574 [Tulasnella sp. UAMH 9824]
MSPSPSHCKTEEFLGLVLTLLRIDLRVETWDAPGLKINDIKVERASDSLSNDVFFVSAPDAESPPRKVLIRIYGSLTSLLANRANEVFIVCKLSSVYQIGARIFGTFGNGRIEEFFESRALTEEEIRVPEISRWIAQRMAELHRVDIGEVMSGGDFDTKSHVSILNWYQTWLPLAREVLGKLERSAIPEEHPWRGAIQVINLNQLEAEIQAYWDWLEEYEKEHGESDRVFSHNDTGARNLLRLTTTPANRPAHYQIALIDFEWASPNPAAFDIANHFQEWPTSYDPETTQWLTILDRYPNLEQRQNFYHAYISPLPTSPSTLSSASQRSFTPSNFAAAHSSPNVKDQIDHLDGLVRAWGPACHVMWTLVYIIVAQGKGEGESNYIGWAAERVEWFRLDIANLGIKA